MDDQDKNYEEKIDDLEIDRLNYSGEEENDSAPAEDWEENEEADEEEETSEEEAMEAETEEGKGIFIPSSKLDLLKKILENMAESGAQAANLLSGLAASKTEERIAIGQMGDDDFISRERTAESRDLAEEGRIVEGVFDGEKMIGPDGKQYNVPANYASKSRLVEGDIMKLTIAPNGAFIFKQIGPIERSRLAGKLEETAEGNFLVAVDGKKWHILTASVTYFKGEAGDEAIILVPKYGESRWAAVENVIKIKS